MSHRMDRRSFLDVLRRSAAIAAAGSFIPRSRFELALPPKAKRPQIALTVDDPTVDLGTPAMAWAEANRRILAALSARKIKAALFVCGMRVDSAEGKHLLSAWDDAGHLLGNHSYSHFMYMSKTSYEQFAADFLRDEPVVAPYRNRVSLFRYPFLKEGDTAEKRDRFRALLKQSGYGVGHVTIDTSDWYIDQRMIERLKSQPNAALERYRDYLIAHVLDRASFYRQLAVDGLGHDVLHTILVHYKMIHALFLPDVMDAFEKAGWAWIDASRAYQDPVFLREPKTLPAGESLVWALAHETGKFEARLRWPGEDDTYEKPKMDALGL
jgi:peptidoglycan-N-acetylglucosamine deacetylase